MADPVTLNGQGVLALSQLLRGFGTLNTFRPVAQVRTDGIGNQEAVTPPEATSARSIARQTPPQGIVGVVQGTAPRLLRGSNPGSPLGENLDLLA